MLNIIQTDLILESEFKNHVKGRILPWLPHFITDSVGYMFLSYWWETYKPQENLVIWVTKNKISGSETTINISSWGQTHFSLKCPYIETTAGHWTRHQRQQLKIMSDNSCCSFLVRCIWKHSEKCKELCNIRYYFYYLNILMPNVFLLPVAVFNEPCLSEKAMY